MKHHSDATSQIDRGVFSLYPPKPVALGFIESLAADTTTQAQPRNVAFIKMDAAIQARLTRFKRSLGKGAPIKYYTNDGG
jgi:hypothetical protein